MLSLDSKFASGYANRACANIDRAKYAEAIVDLSKAVCLDPKYGKAFYNRAKAYEKLGKSDLAKKDQETAQELGYTVERE